MTPWIGYFETFQTNLLSGREFTTSDTASGQPVATVNESFARVHFAGADPVGRQFKRIRPNNKESEGIVVSRSRQPPRGRALAALAAAVALGLASRRYRPVLPFVIAEYAGDTLWATAVFFVLRLIRPAASGIALAAVTLAIAYAVELSQLAHPRWLDALRQQPGVALILGYDFVTSDLACYTAGVMLAWAIDAVIRPRGPAAQSSS